MPTADVPLPVMVWVHGGGYIAGSAASPWYDGRSFTRDGVVMVSVSYRLGFDGFGWLPDRPSNRGLADVLLALQWVRANIARFGGDPHRVTIAGQSAGGGLVMTLLAMPEAWPLFARAIALSAVALEIPVARAQAVTAQLASALGVSPDFAGFAAVDERTIIDAQSPEAPVGPTPDAREVLQSFANFTEDLLFGPIVGIAPYDVGVTEALSTGKISDAPVLFGATRDEFTAIAVGASKLIEHLDSAEAIAVIGLPQDTASDYLAANPLSDSTRVAGRLVSDLLIRGSIPVWAGAMAQPTWAYDFAWEEAPSGLAEHCFDLPFAFDLLDTTGVPAALGTHPPQVTADVLHSGLVRFIHGDNPGWPTTGDSGTRALVLSTGSSVDPYAYAAALSARRAYSGVRDNP